MELKDLLDTHPKHWSPDDFDALTIAELRELLDAFEGSTLCDGRRPCFRNARAKAKSKKDLVKLLSSLCVKEEEECACDECVEYDDVCTGVASTRCHDCDQGYCDSCVEHFPELSSWGRLYQTDCDLCGRWTCCGEYCDMVEMSDHERQQDLFACGETYACELCMLTLVCHSCSEGPVFCKAENCSSARKICQSCSVEICCLCSVKCSCAQFFCKECCPTDDIREGESGCRHIVQKNAKKQKVSKSKTRTNNKKS
jgi:hypothetical protein